MTLTKLKIYKMSKITAKEAAQALGQLGGKSTSEAKKQAAKRNGKKGGRPKKSK